MQPLHTLCSTRLAVPQTAVAVGQQLRGLFGKGVPEFWGKDSPYHPGTTFLGTPPNHLELVAKRPLSPDVVDIDMRHTHYKFPVGAISSITNRVTGVILSVGAGAAGYLALAGDLPGAIATLQTSYPLLVFPAKAAVAFPLVYHYLGGLRHVYWDHAKLGNMAEARSALELPSVVASSKALMGASAAATVLAAAYTL